MLTFIAGLCKRLASLIIRESEALFHRRTTLSPDAIHISCHAVLHLTTTAATWIDCGGGGGDDALLSPSVWLFTFC